MRPDVIRFLHFTGGLATIVVRCCPQGRWGNPEIKRYRRGDWITYVQVFRGVERAEAASFFSMREAVAWLMEELGELQLTSMPRRKGETDEQVASFWRRMLEGRGAVIGAEPMAAGSAADRREISPAGGGVSAT